MEDFKHSDEAKNLKGFELMFYNGVVRMGTMLCEFFKTKPFITEVSKLDNSIRVSMFIKRGSSPLTCTKLLYYGNLLSTHFSAIFTPMHYRPYDFVNVHKVKYKEEIEIIGSYSGGE